MDKEELIKIRTRAVLDFLTNNPAYQLNSREWLVFLTIAMEEGKTTPELIERLGIPQQTLSRKIRNLSQFVGEDGRLVGFNLVHKVPNGKTHSLYLTAEGAALWREYSDMHVLVDEKIIAQVQAEIVEA